MFIAGAISVGLFFGAPALPALAIMIINIVLIATLVFSFFPVLTLPFQNAMYATYPATVAKAVYTPAVAMIGGIATGALVVLGGCLWFVGAWREKYYDGLIRERTALIETKRSEKELIEQIQTCNTQIQTLQLEPKEGLVPSERMDKKISGLKKDIENLRNGLEANKLQQYQPMVDKLTIQAKDHQVQIEITRLENKIWILKNWRHIEVQEEIVDELEGEITVLIKKFPQDQKLQQLRDQIQNLPNQLTQAGLEQIEKEIQSLEEESEKEQQDLLMIATSLSREIRALQDWSNSKNLGLNQLTIEQLNNRIQHLINKNNFKKEIEIKLQNLKNLIAKVEKGDLSKIIKKNPQIINDLKNEYQQFVNLVDLHFLYWDYISEFRELPERISKLSDRASKFSASHAGTQGAGSTQQPLTQCDQDKQALLKLGFAMFNTKAELTKARKNWLLDNHPDKINDEKEKIRATERCARMGNLYERLLLNYN